MSEIETKNIKTPIDKHDVVLKAWITGRDKRTLRNIFLGGMKIGNSGQAESKAEPSKLIEEAEDRAMELIVVSVNGKKEKVIDAILAMKAQDYDFVIAEINKVHREEDFLA